MTQRSQVQIVPPQWCVRRSVQRIIRAELRLIGTLRAGGQRAPAPPGRYSVDQDLEAGGWALARPLHAATLPEKGIVSSRC